MQTTPYKVPSGLCSLAVIMAIHVAPIDTNAGVGGKDAVVQQPSQCLPLLEKERKKKKDEKREEKKRAWLTVFSLSVPRQVGGEIYCTGEYGLCSLGFQFRLG
jgi:hypothetical protein